MNKKSLLLLLTSVLITFSFFAQQSNVVVKSEPITAPAVPQLINSLTHQTSVVSNGGHDCKSHDFTKKYYESKGLWTQFQEDYNKNLAAASSPSINKTPGTNNIAIIFHVVHNPNNPSENVSNALIMSVYNDIVEDYQLNNADAANARPAFTPADANINFCLATKTPTGTPLLEPGVFRVSTTEDFYDINNGEENKMKSSATGGSQIWDRSKYLNVWICDITNGASSGVAGYAYRPTTTLLPSSSIDGIVIDYNLGVNNDNILTHEIGHYLGLDHTWGGSGSCTVDDGFADTPNTAGPSFNFSGSCSGNQTTCSGVQTQYENYMDYSNCTVMFTQLQANYMLSILTGIRASLLTSTGCDPVNAPPVANFTADIASPIIIPVGGTVSFTDLSTNAPTSWLWDFNGGATNSTVQNPSKVFNTIGSYTVTLTATNSFGSDGEIKTAYVQVVAAAAGTSCDTLRNWNPAAAGNFTYYLAGTAPQWGYIPGHNNLTGGQGTFNTQGYAEKFTSPTTAQVRQVRMPIFKLSNLSGAGQLTLKVYTNSGTNLPGVVLATQVIPFSSLTNNAYNIMDFATPTSVTGAFWVSYELNYGSPQDTMVVGTKATILGGNDGFAYKQNNVWGNISDDFTITNSSIAMDVLLSNGLNPVASFTMTNTVYCVGAVANVNGSSSLNATSYEWYLTDNPVTTIIAQATTPSASFTLATAGARTIYLYANGACKSDEATLNFNVYAQITASVAPTATTCGYDNGTITVNSAAGGGGTGYTYSVDGSSFQSSNVFSNLASGTYTVSIKSPGNNCLKTYSTTIAASTEFLATVSNNEIICETESATLTAGGGVSYAWFEGLVQIGSTATITVTPATSTQYSCEVTDGSGCVNIVYVDVTVEICNGLAENSKLPLTMYPNPANSELNLFLGGNFEYKLYDSRGRLLTFGGALNTQIIDVSTFESGMYLLEISQNSKVSTFRVIKK